MNGKIFCSHSAIWPIVRLKPNPSNPNTHPKEQIRLLAKIIEQNGWRSPIVVSKRSGLIVKGHARHAAALVMGAKEVPVDVQAYANAAHEQADMIADNRIAELSEIDDAKLALMLKALGEIDFESMGFDKEALEKLMGPAGKNNSLNPVQGEEQFQVIVECKNEADQSSLFKKLTAQGRKCQLLTS